VFNKCKSDYFACDNGIRQGENVSPFLFSLFLNDLISKKDCKVNILSEVEYPLRKPDWFSLKTEKDSENAVNLSFSIAVKS
jgi:hypothetical protein